jgi:hypothetical protein
MDASQGPPAWRIQGEAAVVDGNRILSALHSYTDVAKLFKECTDYKELAKFMVLCRELRSELVRLQRLTSLY